MKSYDAYLQPKSTPQTVKADQRQVRNNAGGFVFKVSDWDLLNRFLILGTEAGTFYVQAEDLTAQNADTIIRLIQKDGYRVIETIADVVANDRAPKMSPVLFVLALCVGYGDAYTRQLAYAASLKECRTGSHFLEFQSYVEQVKGWGRQRRRYAARWYNEREPKHLAYQMLKYRNRSGFAHRDVLRLSHAKPKSHLHDALFYWATKGWEGVGPEPHPEPALQQIWAYERAKASTDKAEVIRLIKDYRLTHEMIDNSWKNDCDVWEALLQHMPLTALIRNLGKISSLGFFKTARYKMTAQGIVEILTDPGLIERAHIHPFAFLMALYTYESGGGFRGKLTWTPEPAIINALDTGFYTSFSTLKPTGRRRLVAVDCSGSMSTPIVTGWQKSKQGRAQLTQGPLSCRHAAIALAMTAVHADEATTDVIGFVAKGTTWGEVGFPYLESMPVSKRQRLTDVIRLFNKLPGGGTDLSVPFEFALQEAERGQIYDSIEIYTDDETWAGRRHPHEVLAEYRRYAPNVKVAIISMAANPFTVGDPNDPNVLQAVGFDAGMPEVLEAFLG